MIKITKLPDQTPDEKIYGCQIIVKNYAIDLYLQFHNLKFYFNYDRDFKDLAISCGIFMIGFTNLNYEWEL